MLDNPQDKTKTVHVAGTSGKGTTVALISSILTGHGFSVGSMYSPHVYDVRERAMINNQLIEKQDFAKGVEKLLPVYKSLKKDGIVLSFFEIISMLGFAMFAQQKLDYSVIETGVGGQLDATNNISRRDKLAVITRIGLDHTSLLGETLEEIAHQKAGILTGEHGFVLEDAKLKDIFMEVGKQNDTTVGFVSANAAQSLPNYMADNVAMAMQATQHLAERDGWRLDKDVAQAAIDNFQLPGRLEQQSYGEKTIVFDGSHNPQKIEAMIEGLRHRYPGGKFGIVFASSHPEHVEKILAKLEPITSEKILTNFHNPTLRSFKPEISYSKHTKATVTNNHAEVVKVMLGSQLKTWLVCGSFYILPEIKDALDRAGKQVD